MTSKADFKKQYESQSPEDRRLRLDELGALGEALDLDENTDLRREHDTLAEMVAEDEEKGSE